MALEEVVYEYFSETAGDWYDGSEYFNLLNFSSQITLDFT